MNGHTTYTVSSISTKQQYIKMTDTTGRLIFKTLLKTQVRTYAVSPSYS